MALDRDVILLAESGEEGASQLGMGFMVAEHYPEIDAEFCIAEGGDTIRERGEVRYAAVQVTEKVVRGVELTAAASRAMARCRCSRTPSRTSVTPSASSSPGSPTCKIDETTGRYFRRLAGAGVAGEGQVLPRRDLGRPEGGKAAADWLFANEPRHASMARTSVSPNIFDGGYRSNVIPSEAKARLDVRMVPGEDAEALLAQIRKAINDPAVDVQFAAAAEQRPAIPATRLDSDLFTSVEAAVQDGLPACRRCRR